ncbi:zinc transporter ZIP11 [Galendromus occidentalis]|uniref:Zinc transporter ZIP11 n=1 Tax=Galendromus occidentalis TaxID=34638 RepID=A0AAJ6QSE4_9ACAR|nr:zinc transporter ZIP11 [Galendromus occidentalis]
MIRGIDPTAQTVLGTLLTWGLTAAGAACVFILNSSQRKVLDGSLGFAAGVMLAASYWSLLKPSLEIATGSHGEQWCFIPTSIGIVAGAFFVYIVDVVIPENNTVRILMETNPKKDDDHTRRMQDASLQWKRMLMLIIAITMHNIPEGMAVGVGFGAANSTDAATFASARNLAIGIGMQNFPEGLAVSLPLRAAGFSKKMSFWYGQLSGAVEPIFGVIGCLLVTYAQVILSYALAFAAGAMIYVVVDDIIPESQQCGNGRIASWSTIVGFIVMMTLDVTLG